MRLTTRLSTLALLASPLLAVYTYYRTDPFSSINTTIWQPNQAISASSGGLVAATATGGSVISMETVPGGFPNSHEVRAKLTLTASGGSYILYVRASQDAWLNPGGASSGTFVAVEVANPVLSGTGCSATVKVWRGVSGALTLLGEVPTPCANGMEIRAIAQSNSTVMYLVDNVMFANSYEPGVITGRPGMGGFAMPAGNAIARVDLGQIDTTPPSQVPATAIATAVFDRRVEMQWPGADDGANGIGVWGYQFYRDGMYVGGKRFGEMVDNTVQPGTTYTYTIQPMDYHMNHGTHTTFTVTTPADGNIDPRKLGVRPLGTYWGGLGEQIDLQSGNLNFSLPLFKAVGRGGWGVSFALSYNSQNWRRDTAGSARTWNHARDVGYGYGWKMLAGSMTPIYSDYWTLGLFRFTDSTGAEYRFTVQNGDEWTTKEGLFLTYNAAQRKLYFPDGSWWYFGSVASGTEMDTGTMYPTLFQDRNGNQIKVRYKAGRGMTDVNGSSRVWEVEDVRVSAGLAAFTCSYVADTLQHLNTCTTASGLNTGENYQVGIGAATGLTDPFLGASFGDKQTLNGITNISPGINSPFYFGYDAGATNGPGELTAAVYPYGGSLSWSYAVGTLAGGRQFRKVATRAYNANDGHPPKPPRLPSIRVRTPSCRYTSGPWSSIPPIRPIKPIGGIPT